MIFLTAFDTAAQVQRVSATETFRLPQGVRTVLRHTAAFLCGLLLSSLRVTPSTAPFGVCFLAAAPTAYVFSAGSGAAAGYLLTLDSVAALRYVAALLCAAVLLHLLETLVRPMRAWLAPLVSGGVLLLTGIAVIAADGFHTTAVLHLTAEAGGGFLCTAFFKQGVSAATTLCGGTLPEPRQTAGLCAIWFALLATLSDLAMFGVSPARVAAYFTVAVWTSLFATAGGAVAGITAAGAFLFSPTRYAGIGLLAAGLAATLTGGRDRRWIACCCAVASGAVFLLSDGADAAPLFLESVLGNILYIAVPYTVRSGVRRFFHSVRTSPAAESADGQAALQKLMRATDAVEAMAADLKQAAQMSAQALPADAPLRFARTKEAVCDSCGRYGYCWEQHRRETLSAFAALDAPLRAGAPLDKETVPSVLQARCIRLTALTTALQRYAVRDAEHTAAQAKLQAVRQANAERFDGIVDMLHALSAELAAVPAPDAVAAARVREALSVQFRLSPQRVTCTLSEKNRLRLVLEFEKPPKELPASLTKVLAQTVGRRLGLPHIQTEGNSTRILLCEQTAYAVETGAAQIVADREKRSGDSFESFYDEQGGYFVVLSDGMGQGMRAALDSALTVKMTAGLLRAGVDVHSALRMVNASLMLKADGESLATLDILHIDLYSGEAVFYKAGAAKSLVRRGDKCTEIKRSALPVGILREVRFGCCGGTLRTGDLVVLASDGAFDYADAAFCRAARTVRLQADCAAIAKELAECAKRKNPSYKSDDITVLALKIRSNTA